MNYAEIREACCEANRQLPLRGLVDLTFGNVSVCDREAGVFAIKPSGVAYDALKPEDMIIIRLGNDATVEVVEGEMRHSSDTPTHLRLLQAFPAANAVVHTHSRNATSWAQACQSIPCLGTTHADYFHGPVPVTRCMTEAEVIGNYEWETGNVIVERFQDLDPATVTAVLVAGHGPFVWGKSAAKAVETAEALEIISEMAWKARLIGLEQMALPAHVLDKHYCRKHGPSAYYGQA